MSYNLQLVHTHTSMLKAHILLEVGLSVMCVFLCTQELAMLTLGYVHAHIFDVPTLHSVHALIYLLCIYTTE